MLVTIALAFLLGLVLAAAAGTTAKLVLGTVALGVASVLAMGGDALHSRLWRLPLGVAAFLAGLAMPPPPVVPLLTRETIAVVAVVESETVRPERRDVVVRVVRAERGQVPRGTRLRVPDAAVSVGARIRLVGDLVPSLAPRNPSPHPPFPEARPSAGIVPENAARSIVPLAIGAFDAAIAHARARTRRALEATLSRRAHGVATALVLGDGAMLDDEDASAVKGAGLTHVLAVSGTHIAMVGGAFVFFVDRLLRRFRSVLEPWRWAAACGVPFALLHAAYAGSVPSGWRAAVTAAIAWTLVAAGRRPDALETTATATLVLALPSPTDAVRPGFLLSVLATIAVITAPRPADESLAASLRAAWSLTWRCSLATATLVVYAFGDVPLASLVANVVLVPLGSVALLPLSLVHTIAALTHEGLASFTAACFEPCAAAFLEGSRAFASVDDGVALAPPTVVQALVLVAAASWVVARLPRPHPALVVVAVVLFVGDELRVRRGPWSEGALEILQLDVGQGDAAMIRLPDGARMLVDFGPNRPDAGARVLVPLLRAHRWSRVDLAVLTHRHPDHYGGLESTAAAIPITALLEPGEADPEEARHGGEAAGVLARVAARGTHLVPLRSRCGRPVRHGGASVEVLAPCPSPVRGASLNDNSIVFRIRYGRHAFLFVGDAEEDAEARLLDAHRDALRADVLKVGHHGSRTSSTAAFLDAVRPRFALVSAGLGNRFEHPHSVTLRSLAAVRARVLRTDRHGGIRIVSDGRTMRVDPTER